ncbi:MAG: Gfo/Idh/MocA family oxidoreductase [Clostridia bacterium]|nr:Gfo/Idh/MocA family oxidoreductase [Clostridia bacterium]
MAEKTANFGVIGISGRGSGMLREFLSAPGVVVTAVCDKYEDRARRGAEIVKEVTGRDIEWYTDYKELLAREDIKGVLICTTWITHARIAIDAMRAGKHAAFEVGGAASIEECWQMVRTSEETGKICMMIENCCYDRNEMAIFNMIKKGLFGEIVHMEGGYRHDLRDEINLGKENRHGRLANFTCRNGELYPTHQLGPIAKALSINRGNRFISLTSMASKSVGLHDWIVKNRGEDYYNFNRRFNCGDVVTTLIKCANGETVTLTHDCSLVRPYSRNYVVQGTNAIYNEGLHPYPNVIAIDGEGHSWKDFDPIREEHEHPLWKKYVTDGVHAGHGGMDFLVLCAYAEAAVNDLPSPIDVYDTATWMAVTVLSEQSIALGSAPVAFPDFTSGAWIDREPYRRGMYCLEEVCEDCFPVCEEKTEE